MKNFFCVTILLLTMSALNVRAQEQVPAPTFKEGDSWQFKVTEENFVASNSERLSGTYELKYSQGKVKVNLLTGDKREEIAVGQDRPGESLVALLGVSEILQNLKFPLSVGQKWEYRYRWQVAGAKAATLRIVEVNVGGFEQATTPAGTFKALKTSTNARWPRPQLGPFSSTTSSLYSPETKSVVKSSYSDVDGQKREIELVKFDSGK
jgi:hypothetical protein